MEEALGLESVLLDTGVLYALADHHDAWHRRCAAFVEPFDGRLLVPSTVLPEATCLLGKHLGRRAELTLVKALADGELAVVHFTAADLARCVQLLETHADAAVGFVDASVVAIAERLKIARLLTTDRRHFAIFRDRGRQPYTLLP